MTNQTERYREASQERSDRLSEYRPLSGRLGDTVTFFAPCLQFLQFRIVGTLFGTDLILLAICPLTLIYGASASNKRFYRRYLFFGCLWLFGQALTDAIRSTPFEDYARGWAMIGFTLTNFLGLYFLLSGDTKRTILYALGSAVGSIASYLVNPVIFASSYPWEFGYGFGLTIVVVVLATWASAHRHYVLAVVLLFGAAALNLYNGFRSEVGECSLAATFVMSKLRANGRASPNTNTSRVAQVRTFATLIVSLGCIVQLYGYCAGNGMLGEVAQEKFDIQSSGRYGLLVGGRSQFLSGLDAAIKSPVIGYGSWAKDWRYSGRDAEIMTNLGYAVRAGAGPDESWVIPSHSYIIGAWVNTGILGVVFWLWVLSLPVRVLVLLTKTGHSILPLLVFGAGNLMWNLCFSPYGADQRLYATFFTVMMISVLESQPMPPLSPAGIRYPS
jgi:hypothetical protein